MKHKCKNIQIAGATVLAALLLGACSKNASDKRPVLVVSIAPEKYILEQLGADDFNIVTLMPNGSNPETFEIPISGRKAVDNAAAYFSTGLFPFENNLSVTSGSSANIVNISDNVDFIYGTHDHSHEHSSFLHTDGGQITPDPHIWTSVSNARVIAQNMATELIKIDPDNEEKYRDRLMTFEGRLDSIHGAIKTRLKDKEGTTFMVWHPSLSYFARDYHLNQLAVGSESKELSPRTLRETIDTARAADVKIFFFQKEFDSRQAEAINSGVGSEMVVINPSNYNWEEELEKITSYLEK